MSLTISQPAKTEFGGVRFTHDFSPRISLAKSRLSPQPRVDSPLSSLRASLSTDSAPASTATHSNSNNHNMATPHRGLPPPSAMTLPDPGRPHPPPLTHSLGPMPAPPNQWQDQEESMRNWLAAKVEEDKRRQEEERTKQESFKLDQRRIEQSMLRDALSGGVPPSMVPMIYAGIGGSNLANFSLEWLQQYAAQLHAAQQQFQQQQSPIEARRGEGRLLGQPPSQYSMAQPQQHHQVVPSQPMDQSQPPPFSAYQQHTPSRMPPTSAPRSATHTQLPRLTTNEAYVQQQPPPQMGSSSAHPLQQSQTVQEAPSSSPALYFHHWVPPSESKSNSNNQPQTPASKGGEPHSAHPGSHLSESDYKESPRKRKAQGPHQPAPTPSERPQYTSPPFSTTSSMASGGRKVSHAHSRSGTVGTDSRPQSRRDPEREREMMDSSEDRHPPRLCQNESTEMSEDQGPVAPQQSSSRMRGSSPVDAGAALRPESRDERERERRPDSRDERQ